MKKVLIIAYYFPPLGWSGVQRTLKFVKYLRNFGWKPVVVTVGRTKFSVLDESLMEEIPKEIEIIRIDDVKFKDITDKIKEKMREYTKYSFDIISDEYLKNQYEKRIDDNFEKLRNLFLLPDGNAIWANNVIRKISKKINFKDISVIYTTSSPYSTHIIGYYLKKKYKLPWVTDFRDEWTNNPYYSFNEQDIRYKIERNIEKTLIESSDKIITITPISMNNYISLFNVSKDKVVNITNGYDEEDFNFLLQSTQKHKFKIISNGSFYLDISPETFLIAIKNILNKKLVDKKNLSIDFIGTIEEKIKNNIENLGLGDIINYEGYLPHIDSLKKSANANLLLLVVGKGEKVKSVYTGKVFEYLRLKRPILALSPAESVVEKLLNETGCGINVEYDKIDEIEKCILKIYNEWISKSKLVVNESKIKKYERKNLTKKLAEVFNELTTR